MSDQKTSGALWYSILSTFYFISMAFLIICCVTSPVFKQIGLSRYHDYSYGVLGYCDLSNDSCSKAAATYNPVSLSTDSDNWKLSDSTRDKIGKILIVIPVAAGVNFFTFIISFIFLILVLVDRFISSSSFFIVHLLFAFLSFCGSALSCIIVFLLFFPNITWCSWLLIPAAALPLITLPIIFLAHSYGSVGSFNNDSDDNESYDAELINILDKNDDMKSNGLILPDFQQAEKNSHSNITLLDNSMSTLSLKEKNAMPLNQVKTLNDNDTENEIEEELQDEHQQMAYSAINSDKLLSNHGSIKSKDNKFNYSNNLNNKNSEDRLYDLTSSSEGSFNITERQNDLESDSGLTSVSQRGVNPHYIQYQRQQQQQQQQQQQKQQQQRRPQFYNNNSTPMQSYGQNTLQMPQQRRMNFNNKNSHFNQQQQYNREQQPPQQPPQQQQLCQQQYQPQQFQQQQYQPQQFQQQQYQQPIINNPPPPGSNLSSNRYKPAYKAKMSRYNLPSSSLDSPYGFR